MDDTYQIYVNRVAPLTLPATYQSQLPHIQASPKFQQGKAIAFPGYSIITPPGNEDAQNDNFYRGLIEVQARLVSAFGNFLIPLPPESFHLTIADLIWESQYKAAIAENLQFETQLKDCIRDSFQQYKPSWLENNCIQWQILGLLVFPRALAVALVPKQEADYLPILQLRRSLYQNPELIALGIEQQYHYTAHITLGYFDEIPADLDRDCCTQTLCQLNDHWLEMEPQVLKISEIQLRRFTDMTHFHREADYPTLNFSDTL
ncbi:MAG: DUF1868 domain-containing protein [Snowella sp.]|nr:DUF1868 domain-containing protein [Snowella sp.]